MITQLSLAALLVGAAAAQDVEVTAQANTFTRSTQDAAALAPTPDGGAVLVWQSRRQQEGTYGVYARRFGADGAPVGPEVQVNATVAGHQTQPAVAVDSEGAAWFAWRSFGQDGSLGSIVARRFDPRLETATAEVLVNDVPAGDQAEPVVVAHGGGALVAWLDPLEGLTSAVRARQLGPEGAPAGAAFDVASGADHRTATAVAGIDGVTFAYARLDGVGAPAGVFVRTLVEGELGEEQRLDVAGGIQAIEPALASAGGVTLAGWLESERDGYGLRVRTLKGGTPGPVRELATGDGWVSGLALALDGAGGALATWNEHVDGEKREPGLFARHLDPATARPTSDTFRVTKRAEGRQAIAVATASAKCALFEDGRLAVAWQGDAGGEDASAVHLTLRAPAGVALAASTPQADGPRFEDPSSGAAVPTHDPPTFDPRQVERDRSDEQGPAGGAVDFLAFTSTGWVPPDPEMGVGPDHIVAMVNGGISWFLKDGTQQFFQDINGSGGFWGSEGASGFVYDPEVVYDVHSERFFCFASDANAGFLLAVSDDSDPNGSWNKYKINTAPIFGTSNVDSGNLAVDEEFITITGDIFSPDRLVMLFIDKASAMSGGPLQTTDTILSGRQSMGTCTNLDPGSGPLYLTWADEFTTSNSIRIYAVRNRATSPSIQFTTLTVPQYSHPADPPQQGTTVRPELFEARFWSSMIVGGRLWAVHHEGSQRARVQWYEIDLGGWPGGGAPSLVQSGEIDLGTGLWSFFPSIWADVAGNAAITFSRSSTSEFISMQMATRTAGDPAGTFGAPVEIRPGKSPDASGRFGDYSATNHDPAMAGSFWGHHEYRGQANWRTRIGRVDTCTGGTVNYCTTSPNSAGSGALISTAGSVSIAANDLVLAAKGAPVGQFGLFFFGDAQQSTPVGDGTLCVGGSILRLPVVTIDGSGQTSYALDLTNLSGGLTLTPGDVQNFQLWFRDPGFGTGSNLSDAVQVTFCN